jgi:hypothetical protein
MSKALNAHRDNFKIIEDVENIDHLRRYILKLYNQNFSSQKTKVNSKKDVTLAKHNWHLSKKVTTNLIKFTFEHPIVYLNKPESSSMGNT